MSDPINRSDTAVIVCAYKGDEQQVRNNLPVYLHHKCPVIIMSPTDAPITDNFGKPEQITTHSCGLKGWIGPQTLERQLLMMRAMLSFPSFNFFLMHDADSVCLSPTIPQYLYDHPDMFWSNEVTDTNPGESLLPKIALQPPYFASRKVLQAMVDHSDTLPTSYISGRTPEGWPLPHPTQCIDHYLLQLSCGSGFPHFNFHTGASFETNSTHGLDTMAKLVLTYGRVLLHSVKKKEALERLIAERRNWCRNNGIKE